MKKNLILAMVLVLAMAWTSEGAEPRSFPATIISVHDGDTCRAVVDLGFGITITESFRLVGVDAPELPTKAGVTTGDKLRERINLKNVEIIVPGREKYGRWLAVVMLSGENINEWLVKEGLAKPYDGGKRTP